MASVYTGKDGSFTFAGNNQVRARSWTVESTTNVLDKSELGSVAVGNMVGLKSYTGTATLVYYSNDTKISAMLEKVFRTGETEAAVAEFKWGTDRIVSFSAIITSASISASAGEVITADISFTAEGDLDEKVV